MQDIEPYYSWRHMYISSEDELSPFYGREYSEFEYSNTVYNYYIHPQWDDFGSTTLYMKVIFADYEQQYAIIEFIGEWNDAINNDIMMLKRDIIDEMIADYGISSRCVEAGGDMVYHNPSQEPLRVGLEHPEDASLAIGVALVHDGHSICGSAGNRRSWGQYHHIINPKTLESPRHILAVWAIANTTILADMLTSCLFFVPPQKLLTQFAFEYVIMYADHSVEHSPGFKGEIFS